MVPIEVFSKGWATYISIFYLFRKMVNLENDNTVSNNGHFFVYHALIHLLDIYYLYIDDIHLLAIEMYHNAIMIIFISRILLLFE